MNLASQVGLRRLSSLRIATSSPKIVGMNLASQVGLRLSADGVEELIVVIRAVGMNLASQVGLRCRDLSNWDALLRTTPLRRNEPSKSGGIETMSSCPSSSSF